ncbi:MAG: CUB domain-containing protein, partial [Bacteroidota bacterium]
MKGICTILFLSIATLSLAQPTYNMQNLTVDDCEGFLLDSEAGDVPGTYDHNENFTFSICVPDADLITLDFASFCTEEGFDSLRIYDGPDTLSPQIGFAYTGEPDPPTISTSSGCLTVNFISDPNVTCSGWVAQWTTTYFIPEPPEIDSIIPVACESDQLTLFFDRNVHCDSLYAGAFSITGPLFPNVVSAMPNPCMGDSTNSVVLTLSDPIDFSGDYQVFFTNSVTACEDVFVLQSVGNFTVSDCPLNVLIMLDGEAACAGDTTLLVAEASGGDASSYSYQWAPIFAPDTNMVEVVVYGPTFYYVTVTDGSGATATDSLQVVPFGAPTILQNDTTLCQSVDPFILTAFPT